MIEVSVARLGLDSVSSSYVVILQEKGGERLLPIWIGQPEAESIVMEMNHIRPPRPLTHDLCKRLITGMFAAPPGSSTADALRSAERTLMDDAATSHPFYWAAFAIVGDGAAPLIRTEAPRTASLQ